MQVVENTCIGHEISLRKISEPWALKALDFIPVTAQPREMQWHRRSPVPKYRCGTYTASGVQELQLSATPSQSRVLSRWPRHTVTCRYTRGSFQRLWDLRTPVNTQTQEVIVKTRTCKWPFCRNGHSIIIFRIWKTETQSEDFLEGKKPKDCQSMTTTAIATDRAQRQHSIKHCSYKVFMERRVKHPLAVCMATLVRISVMRFESESHSRQSESLQTREEHPSLLRL